MNYKYLLSKTLVCFTYLVLMAFNLQMNTLKNQPSFLNTCSESLRLVKAWASLWFQNIPRNKAVDMKKYITVLMKHLAQRHYFWYTSISTALLLTFWKILEFRVASFLPFEPYHVPAWFMDKCHAFWHIYDFFCKNIRPLSMT